MQVNCSDFMTATLGKNYVHTHMRTCPSIYLGKLFSILGTQLMRTPSSHMNDGSHHEFNLWNPPIM
jgi:hypothetical protein